MPLPRLPFGRLIPSKQLVSGQHINYLSDLLTGTSSGANTALAGGALSAATPQISSAFYEINTVASAGDSVALPPAKSGLRICITNSGANAAQIMNAFGTSDTVQGAAAGTGVSLAAATVAMFICTKDGVWRRFVSA